MTNAKVWIKPTIEVTSIKLAQYNHVINTDLGGSLHKS